MVGHKDLIWTNGKQTFNQIIVILPKNIDDLEKGLINLRSFFLTWKPTIYLLIFAILYTLIHES